MKYRADKFYPDLDPSKPIPEIELRYDAFKRQMMRYAMPIAIVTIVMVVVLSIVLTTRDLSFGVFLALILSAMGLVMLPQIIAFTRLSKDDRKRLIYQNKNDPWGIPAHQQVLYQSYYFGMMVILINLPSLSGGFSAFETLIGFFMILGGLVFTVMTRFMRQPGQISCEKCSYPLVGLTLPCECPECGIALRDLSYTTDRPRVRDSRYLFAGIIVALAGVLVSYVMIKHKPMVYAAIPKGTLISLAPNNTDAFEALTSKSLTPGEVDSLEDALINAIESGNVAGFWRHQQGDWLSNQLANDQLSTQQLDRMMAALGDVYIDAPDRVRVGEQVAVLLRAPESRLPSAELYPNYYFNGYVLSTDDTVYLHSDVSHRWRPLQDGVVSLEPNGTESPYYRFIPESAGRITIQAKLVMVLYPTLNELDNVGFTWNEDGTYAFVSDPIWSRVIELEHTIEVVNE